jgi:hypothetical protein
MTRAIGEAKRAIVEHGSYTVGTIYEPGQSKFTTTHKHPQDEGKSVVIHHVFVDLSFSS